MAAGGHAPARGFSCRTVGVRLWHVHADVRHGRRHVRRHRLDRLAGTGHAAVSVPALFLSAEKDVFARMMGRPGAAYSRLENATFEIAEAMYGPSEPTS